MSYRNPKIFMPDPNAFSKGFESTLQYGVELFAKQKKEKEDLAEKAERAESMLLSVTDLGGYKGLNKELYYGLQNNIRGMVDAEEFAKASPAKQQEMLGGIRNLKQGFEKLQSIISTPADEIDVRNPDILAFKLQLATDPSKIKVTGSGANMSLTWSGAEGEPANEISISDLTSKRIINIKQFEEPLRKFDSDLLKSATAEMINGAKRGRYDDAKNVAKATYSANLPYSLTDEQYAYIYTNKLKPSEKWNASDEQKNQVLEYKKAEFTKRLDAQDPRAKLYEPLPPKDTVNRPTPVQEEVANTRPFIDDITAFVKRVNPSDKTKAKYKGDEKVKQIINKINSLNTESPTNLLTRGEAFKKYVESENKRLKSLGTELSPEEMKQNFLETIGENSENKGLYQIFDISEFQDGSIEIKPAPINSRDSKSILNFMLDRIEMTDKAENVFKSELVAKNFK